MDTVPKSATTVHHTWAQGTQHLESNSQNIGQEVEKDGNEGRINLGNWREVLRSNESRFNMLKGSIAAKKGVAAVRIGGTTGQSQLTAMKQGDTSDSLPTQNVAGGNEPCTVFESPALSRRNEGLHISAEDLVGPLGSFKEHPKCSSAVDLIRTASHDQSSHSVSQALALRFANVPSAYSEVERTGYYRPSDRIGRLYTSTAVALTSSNAHSVAKATIALAAASGAPVGGSNGKIGSMTAARVGLSGGGKLVTAPSASKSGEILQRLAKQSASHPEALSTSSTSADHRVDISRQRSLLPADDEEGPGSFRKTYRTAPEREDKVARGNSGDEDIRRIERGRISSKPTTSSLPIIDSDQEKRITRREHRSPPRGRKIINVTPPRAENDETCPAIDFTSWNPVAIDHGTTSPRAAAPSGDYGRSDRKDGVAPVVKGESLTEAELQKESITRFWAAVEARMRDGSPNSLGAGAKSPIVDLPAVRASRLVHTRILVTKRQHNEKHVQQDSCSASHIPLPGVSIPSTPPRRVNGSPRLILGVIL